MRDTIHSQQQKCTQRRKQRLNQQQNIIRQNQKQRRNTIQLSITPVSIIRNIIQLPTKQQRRKQQRGKQQLRM